MEAESNWMPAKVGELWTYRELVWFLTLRDLKVRYKQTAVGAVWRSSSPSRR